MEKHSRLILTLGGVAPTGRPARIATVTLPEGMEPTPKTLDKLERDALSFKRGGYTDLKLRTEREIWRGKGTGRHTWQTVSVKEF